MSFFLNNNLGLSGSFSVDSAIDDFCKEHGGTTPIKKVLIANNGIAAVRGIRSLRLWESSVLGTKDPELHFVVMATPEDVNANAEHIKEGDERVQVQGGSNKNNYANVGMISEIARRFKCDAVWVGWGHASENPELPDACERDHVQFLGPRSNAMRALGDKIASTIIAQSAGVPCIPWSGSHVTIPVDWDKVSAQNPVTVPQEDFEKACIKTAEQCKEVGRQLKYPIMLKASEGGGGKGIRLVQSEENVENAFHAVTGEVPGSPIFAMRLVREARHLEVQLLGDKHGNVIALNMRDCSVQRRHQKMIEEGPVLGVPANILQEMQQAAVRLAKSVGYIGAGTVEYLYDKEQGGFYFLELNPRLQVEHPVTEGITDVNIPGAQLCIGMGLPLYRIADIRHFYGRDRNGTEPIDFEKEAPRPITKHTIAVRITAEDPDNGFRPTTGAIEELVFRPPRSVWGYFSVATKGAVHEFADSQFGHVFATAPTREEARKAMVFTLRQLTIKGEIRSTVEYVAGLLERPEFKNQNVSTAWLDALITRKITMDPPNPFVSVACASVMNFTQKFERNLSQYSDLVGAGHVPPSSLLATTLTESLILRNVKYNVTGTKISPTAWCLTMNGSALFVNTKQLKDKGMLIYFGDVEAKSCLCYIERSPTGIRLNIDGKTATFTNDEDPTKLRTPVTGKLVRYLVKDGDYIAAESSYVECEVMKMHMQLQTQLAGKIKLNCVPGSSIVSGQVLAEIEPDDPNRVIRAEECKDKWPGARVLVGLTEQAPEPVTKAPFPVLVQRAIERLNCLVEGYDYPKDLFEALLTEAFGVLAQMKSAGSSVKLSGVQLACIEGAVPEAADESFESKMLWVFRLLMENYLRVSKLFHDKTRDEVIEAQREEHKSDLSKVFFNMLAFLGQRRQRTMTVILQKVEELGLSKQLEELLEGVAASKRDKDAVVVLQARHMLRRLTMPANAEKVKELNTRLAEISKSGDNQALEVLARQSMIPVESIFDLLKPEEAEKLNGVNTELQALALKLFVRRCYQSFTISDLQVTRKDGHWIAAWGCKEATTSSGGMPFKHGGIIGAFSSDALDSLPDLHHTPALSPTIPHAIGEGELDTFGQGFLATFGSVEELKKSFQVIVVEHFTENEDRARQKSVAELIVLNDKDDEAGLLGAVQQLMRANKSALKEYTAMERLTFCLSRTGKSPLYYTFRRRTDFEEDPIYRLVAPTQAYQMELWRLRNYDLSVYPLNNPRVHLYFGREKGGKAIPDCYGKRLFARVLLTYGDMVQNDALNPAAGEHVLLEALQALEDARADKGYESFANHIFINAVDHPVEEGLMATVMGGLYHSHGERLKACGVDEVEVKFKAGQDLETAKSMRIFARNPTTYALSMDVFVEDRDMHNNVVLKPVELPHEAALELPPASPSTPARGTEQFLNPYAPYPVLSAIARKRLQAHAHESSYVMDWPTLFEENLRRMWKRWSVVGDKEERKKARIDRTDVPGLRENTPRHPMHAEEYILDDRTHTLVPQHKSGRERKVGVVVWVMTFYLPSRYSVKDQQIRPKRAVVVANDITFNSGSFSVTEDKVFALACHMAREEDIPFVYLAANSGARIGVADELKKYFKVKFGDAEKPEEGFQYLYVSEQDYPIVKDSIIAQKIEVEENGTTQSLYKITDIIGKTDGIGVENLCGSGLIAGQMSLCFSTVPTISLVTGRSVGIGAYLNRLGRRVVQNKHAPIILTGYQPLNSLLGSEVYTSNLQIGGPQIMCHNGVSHWEVQDDSLGVYEILCWLDNLPDHYEAPDFSEQTAPTTTPALSPKALKSRVTALTCVTGPSPKITPYPSASPAEQRILLQKITDPWDRTVDLEVHTQTDPRHLIGGVKRGGTQWVSGLFDRDSFRESLQGWAKSVVVGRAKLGGIPVGVIAVETKSTQKTHPADPADPSSAQTVQVQAGNVWFPDSARKTADALVDFDKERLPCFILANWRGFSGGMRDMFDEVLKFGADIVDNLRRYRLPVFVYIPPLAELRGGAWVVIDTAINPEMVEMYADDSAAAGVLEPAGIVEIKFKNKDIYECIERLDDRVKQIRAGIDKARKEGTPDEVKRLEGELKARQEAVFPSFKSIALQFAGLHDTPGRMKRKKAIRAVVPWRESRRYFFKRLCRRLSEVYWRQRLLDANPDLSTADATTTLREAFVETARTLPTRTLSADALRKSIGTKGGEEHDADVLRMRSVSADLQNPKTKYQIFSPPSVPVEGTFESVDEARDRWEDKDEDVMQWFQERVEMLEKSVQRQQAEYMLRKVSAFVNSLPTNFVVEDRALGALQGIRAELERRKAEHERATR